MNAVDSILFLLLLTVLSGLLSRLAGRRFPLPLVQITIGALAAVCGIEIGLQPDIFMLVFLPPLLFADAFLMPLREIRALRGAILFLALVLVVFSTFACGYVIHWLLPQLPLTVCFTLAAALSPTDTVAVSSLLEGRSLPDRLRHLLSGEALFNDASGLVCFRFAAAAAMTGEFSTEAAATSFIIVAIGGVLIGGCISWAAAKIGRMLLRHGLEDVSLQVTTVVLLPFVVYVAAERLGCSGILAAVSGCIVFKLSDILEETGTTTRLSGSAVWQMVSYVFNALIFVLLGLQLPSLLQAGIDLAHAHHATTLRLVTLVVIVYLTMLALRFTGIWSYLFYQWIAGHIWKRERTIPHIAATAVVTVGGVRGAVTLAAVLSLPVALNGNAGFPNRDLIVTLAAGVIVVSLGVAGLIIPPLLRWVPADKVDARALEERSARQLIVRTVLSRLRREQKHLTAEIAAEEEMIRAHTASRVEKGILGGTAAASAEAVFSGEDDSEKLIKERDDQKLQLDVINRLLQGFELRLSQLDETLQTGPLMNREQAMRRERIELALRLLLLRTQRETLNMLSHKGIINDQTQWDIVQEFDYEEQAIRTRVKRLPAEI